MKLGWPSYLGVKRTGQIGVNLQVRCLPCAGSQSTCISRLMASASLDQAVAVMLARSRAREEGRFIVSTITWQRERDGYSCRQGDDWAGGSSFCHISCHF